jgi:prolyl-tRNA synthetase
MRSAYERIYSRCGLQAYAAEAFSGAMGGRESVEFVARTAVGEDVVVHCGACCYTANLEVARSRVAPVTDELAADVLPVEFATPGVLTIDALAAPPFSVAPWRQLKTLVYVADSQPVVAVVRGDDTLNEAKLQIATEAATVRAAQPEEIVALMGAHAGSLGAVGLHAATVLVDASLSGRSNMVTGANRDGFHLRGVDLSRDILPNATLSDLRTARDGEGCPQCSENLEAFPALEVGHIFKQGTRYSARMGATILDATGVEVPLMMGAYGIGLGRLMAAIVEAHHDDDGIIWPASVAPFDAVVMTLGAEPELASLAEAAVCELESAGLEVLYDDRDERAGVKFKDADLIGIPLRIGVGRRGLAANAVEWKRRAAREVELVPLAQLGAHLSS